MIINYLCTMKRFIMHRCITSVVLVVFVLATITATITDIFIYIFILNKLAKFKKEVSVIIAVIMASTETTMTTLVIYLCIRKSFMIQRKFTIM